ncbi:FxSxx-COOH system tetratricopeptide repeat protein [Tengunoibacter tsumagoiensis]|uniref:Tetratricopeptide repeat protein n=1 Tax=Tengunoibacter tsumagoiensis TaxID=2014871 RepID=A0A402A6R8_9CHLR|nr:FxSxx-COOH system tetratricopeptide repeat protein [Tengunoibacter tsumagoiensis]GCE14715.1 tetratricopeptide repeat protein [Tengunoibacter tsumagoiensis]
MARNERLRRQRILRNWRQQDVADKLGTAVLTIQRWERGIQQPGAYYRVKLCALFGLSTQELGLVEENEPSSEPEIIKASPSEKTPVSDHAIWTVPYARNPHFTGREELLSALEQHFSQPETDLSVGLQPVALTQAQAIKGLGGIGKTQTAIEYAYRSRQQGLYHDVFWITAVNEETLLTSFVELGHLLPEVVSADETDQHKIVAAILRWLEQRTQPWLLIFDNADDLEMAHPYFPVQGRGHLLITTRASAIGAFASSLEVETMGTIEGASLLLRRAHLLDSVTPEEMEEAMNIVIELGHFPLAIDQAGAYIEETGCGLQSYLQIYQTYRHALLKQRGMQMTGYPDSVATTWSLSFEQVARTHPAATELLQLCAVLAPDHIPEELLQKGAPHWHAQLREAVSDLFSFNLLLKTLLDFSLIKRLSKDRMVSIHRLVQAVQWDRMDRQTQQDWSERAIKAVEMIFPQDPTRAEFWPQCQRYLEQVQACDALVQQQNLQLPEAADVLLRAGRYFFEHQMFSQAEILYQRALTLRESYWGTAHFLTGYSLEYLAVLQRNNGQYIQAEVSFERALAIREHQLGPDPLEDAASLCRLAEFCLAQQKYPLGETLARQALVIYERQLGTDHLNTTNARHMLASLIERQGHYDKTEAMHLQNLAIRERELGAEHPLTTRVLNNLGILYSHQGRDKEAEQCYKRVLASRQKQLGPSHFQTATAIFNLSCVYIDQGRYEEAEPYSRQALALYEQHLGRHHMQTADCLNGLAIILLHQGSLEQAEALLQEALELHEKHLGPVFPHVGDDLMMLGILYRKQGRYAEAEPLFQRALEINAQTFADVDPQVAKNLYQFALLQEAQGKDEQAYHLYTQALNSCIQGRRFTHALTLDIHQHLMALLMRLGRVEEASQLEAVLKETAGLQK